MERREEERGNCNGGENYKKIYVERYTKNNNEYEFNGTKYNVNQIKNNKIYYKEMSGENYKTFKKYKYKYYNKKLGGTNYKIIKEINNKNKKTSGENYKNLDKIYKKSWAVRIIKT